jgi:hypothetical protein
MNSERKRVYMGEEYNVIEQISNPDEPIKGFICYVEHNKDRVLGVGFTDQEEAFINAIENLNKYRQLKSSLNIKLRNYQPSRDSIVRGVFSLKINVEDVNKNYKIPPHKRYIKGMVRYFYKFDCMWFFNISWVDPDGFEYNNDNFKITAKHYADFKIDVRTSKFNKDNALNPNDALALYVNDKNQSLRMEVLVDTTKRIVAHRNTVIYNY